MALLKEIERTWKYFCRDYYKLDEIKDKNGNIKLFKYFLTTSNYHDSSQINFNYFSSLFTLPFIKLFNTKYNIAIVYLISFLIISIVLFLLLPIDYLTENNILSNDTNIKKCYTKLELAFCFIVPYIFIYFFAGIISLVPNKILDDIYKKKKKILQLGEMIWINSSLVVAVILKNIINKYLIEEKISSNTKGILLSEIIAFLIGEIIFVIILFIFIHCYNEKVEKKVEEKDEYTTSYIGGYLLIKRKYISSLITIKGFCSYLASILTNWKIILVFFINFCSRIQKVKFKKEYKDKITDFWILTSNYFVSLLIFIGLYALIRCILERKDNKKNTSNIIEEKSKQNDNLENNAEKDNESNGSKKESKNYEEIDIIIIWSLLIVFLAVFGFSLYFLYIKDSICWLLYFCIAIPGSLNYFLNFYFSNQEVEFISLSGFIAIAQIIFRSLETSFEPFDSNMDYLWWQIIPSFTGFIFSIIYLCLRCDRKNKGKEKSENESNEQNNKNLNESDNRINNIE